MRRRRPWIRPTCSASPPATSDENAQARHWFEDAKFGLFIHWGVYSLLGKGEWVMDHDKLPISEYAKLPPRFNPTQVRRRCLGQAGQIGRGEIHHDHRQAPRRLLHVRQPVDRLRRRRRDPYQADPLKALADACRQEKIKLFFYYSLLDWHHPDYFPMGKTGQTAGRAAKADPKRYVAYYQGQVRELCTNYGAIGGIWFDGWWDKPDADWDLAGTYRLIHELQPGALVGNNHHVAPFPGEDFQMFEQDLPGENAAGFNTAGIAARLPLETCMTINQSWGYNARDKRFKTAEQLIHALLGAAGRGANLLLNVGPRPTGPSARNSPSGCKTSAIGSPPTANRSTAPAGDRSRPRPGVSRPPEDRRNIPARSICTSSGSRKGHPSSSTQASPGHPTCLANRNR